MVEGRNVATFIKVKAAVKVPGVVKITAGNFGGKLRKFQLRLKDVLGL